MLWATIWEGGDEVNIGVRLDNPDKLLNWVVKVKLDLVTGGVDRFSTGELELFNEVFVGNLGESTSFVGVEVDVVNIETSRSEARSLVGIARIRGTPVALSGVVELKVNLDFVVL